MSKIKEVKLKGKVEHKSRISKSGKFKNIRHLIETLAIEDRAVSQDKVDAAVKKEFPDSSYILKGNHWPWYKCKIITKGEFTQMPSPLWAKNASKQPKKLKGIEAKKEIDKKKKPIKDTVVKKVKALIPKFKKEEPKPKAKKVQKPIVDDDDDLLPIKSKIKKPKKFEPSNEDLADIELEELENLEI